MGGRHLPWTLPERERGSLSPAPGSHSISWRGQNDSSLGPEQAYICAVIQTRKRSLLGPCSTSGDQSLCRRPRQWCHGFQAGTRKASIRCLSELSLLHNKRKARPVLRLYKERGIPSNVVVEKAGRCLVAATCFVLQPCGEIYPCNLSL